MVSEENAYLLEKDREKNAIFSRYHNCWNFCLIFHVMNDILLPEKFYTPCRILYAGNKSDINKCLKLQIIRRSDDLLSVCSDLGH